MIFLLLSVLSGDYQNLFMDAENLGMGGIRTSHPLSVFDNPVSSSLNPTSITIHGALNFLGLSRSIAINGGMKRGNRSMGFALLYNRVPDIEDTRNALIDENGNGILDPGEDIDSTKIVYFTSHQSLLIIGFSRKTGRLYTGFSVKFLYQVLGEYRGIGAGFDFGLFYKLKNVEFGLTIRDVSYTSIFWENLIEKIPPRFDFGGTYFFDTRAGRFIISVESIIDEMGVSPHLGIGWDFLGWGFASIGLNNGALTSGIGLKISQIRTSFSLSLHEELPLTVRFTLSKGFYK